MLTRLRDDETAAGGAVLGGTLVGEATTSPAVVDACKNRTIGIVRIIDRAGACTVVP